MDRLYSRLIIYGCVIVPLISIICVAEDCTTSGDLRLADGATENEGRLEICLRGEWGTVCDDNWGASDAKVSCRQLGRPSEYADAILEFGGGSGKIHYSEFQCSGNETRLDQCAVEHNASSLIDIPCTHVEDAGIKCTNIPCTENAVRTLAQVVQVCHSQQWGFVCSSSQSWNAAASRVTCNEIGNPSENPRNLVVNSGLYDGPIFLNDVLCEGDESSIRECSNAGFGNFTGSCPDIAFAQCEERTACSVSNGVRFTQYNSDIYGRLEVCVGGIWGSVCGNGVTRDVAIVVCREMNHAAVGRVYREADLQAVLHSIVPIRVTNLKCNGNESSLAKCSFDGADGDTQCNHGDDTIIVCLARQCNETEVRLVDGQTSFDGRVEICLDGQWGSVCDDKWDFRDAQVVCRQLQFDGPSYPLLGKGNSGNNTLIHLDDVQCNGTEESFSECKHRGIGLHNCAVGIEEAGVVCTNNTCEDGTVHLVGGDDVLKGRVEYCYQGSWHSVCANGWESTGQEASAICRKLGFTLYKSAVVNYGRGSSSILPFTFDCSYGNTGLSSCSTRTIDPGQCPQVAGVTCLAFCHQKSDTLDCTKCRNRPGCAVNSIVDSSSYICNCYSDCYDYGDCCNDVSLVQNCGAPECDMGDVRLVGGVTNSTGRLEVCSNGVWGRVCNALGYWGPDNARVVCRQLGFSDKGAYVVEGDKESLFGVSSKPAVVGEVHCTGVEKGWFDCSHSTIGDHLCGRDRAPLPDVIISCYEEDTSCKEGDIRLSDGVSSSNGRVEYCRHRAWGSVCSDDWNNNEARVVCRQLGYDANGAIAFQNFADPGGIPITLSGINCIGSEDTLSSCSKSSSTTECTGAVGVTCGKSSNTEKCTGSKGTIPASLNFGTCEVYVAQVDVCTGILTTGLDYVYINKKLGTQETISNALNKNIENTKDVVVGHDNECVDLVYKLLCAYYLPSCGNNTARLMPSSICEDDCLKVQETCSTTWQTVMLFFNNLGTPLRCNDTSRIIFPLPNCCTATAGLSETRSGSSQSSVDPAIVAGTLIVILLVIALVVAGAGIITVILYKRYSKRKMIDMVQLDIMSLPGREVNTACTSHATTATMTNTTLVSYTITTTNVSPNMSNRECEPNEKEIPLESSTIASPNPYVNSLNPLIPAVRGPDDSVAFHNKRPRVHSSRLRELNRGKFVIDYKDITLLDKVGEGEFGIVYKAKLRRSTGEIAVKTLKGNFNQSEIDEFVEESIKMSRFKHSHVMELIGVCLDAGSAPFIIMPYMANGSLQKYLKKERASLVASDENDEDMVVEVRKQLTAMCSQISSGMEYLTGERYIHRDLAARNCMIDVNFLIKITDFGLSEDVFERNYFRQGSHEEVVKLPVKWMAPESLSDGHFSEKSDVWSYGVTMWEIFSGGKAPYPGTDPLSLMQSLEKGERLPHPYNVACNEELYAMMSKCWEMSPEERPTFSEIHTNISKYISRIGGYLEMGYDVFKSLRSV